MVRTSGFHPDNSSSILLGDDIQTLQPTLIARFFNLVIDKRFQFWGIFLMARKKTSAEKRFAQSETRRMHNKAIKSECRTYVKQFVAAVHAKDAKLAQEKLVKMTSCLDSARSKGVLTRNAVSRKVSRMQKLYNVTFAAAN